MMNIIIPTIELLFYYIALLLIYNKIYKLSIRPQAVIISIITITMPLLLTGMLLDYRIFVLMHMAFQFLHVLAVKFSVRKSKFVSIIGMFLLLYAIMLILSVSSNCIMQTFSNDGLLIGVDFAIYAIAFSVCIICTTNKKICTHLRKILGTLPLRIKILTIASFFISAFIVASIVSNPLLEGNGIWNISLKISTVLLALFLCITFPIVILIAMTNAYLKKQNENYEERLEAQADCYTQLSRSNFEMRRFRHDFKNMQIGLRTYIEANDIPSAIAVLDSEQENLQSATDIITYDTGNGIVDAILMDKQQKVADKNIKIEFTGAVPMTALSAVDLCVIFGNTLDNALEACEKLPPDETKTISISSLCNSGFMFITITNPVLENVTIKGNTVETTKNDRNLHGYGLYSLTRAVKKYDGDVKLKSENNTFTVEVELTLI